MQASSALTAASTPLFADAPVQSPSLLADAPVLLTDDELMCVAGGVEQLPVSTW